jgi:serine protease Do
MDDYRDNGHEDDDKEENRDENQIEIFASDDPEEQGKNSENTANAENGAGNPENNEGTTENGGADAGQNAQGFIYGGAPQGDGQNNGYGAGNGYNGAGGQNQGDYSPYGGNMQYKWNYDDYQKALDNQNKPPKKKNKGLRAFVISVCSVFGVAIIALAGVGIAALIRNGGLTQGAIISGASSTADSAINKNSPSLTINNKPAGSDTSSAAVTSPLQMSTEQVYNTVKNSVVTIENYDSQSAEPAAEGSGIVETSDGYIITNEHVIDGASSVEVVLDNNKQYGATIVGVDMRTDLAVLKINVTGLTPAKFGNSDQISVAEPVLAIGNPGGLQFSGSVTEGIVSALNRDVPTESGYDEECIQTDAPINPGNSGGALVNMYGQVIGITSSKIEATGYEGMGFAIPINTAKPVIDAIEKYGYVTGRVKLGISVEEYSPYRGATLGFPSAGLLVEDVDSTSDAAAKGIEVNDIITSINGTQISTYDQFYQIESKYKPGDTVKLTVFRPTTKSTFTVNVKLLEDKGQTSSSASSQQSDGSGQADSNSPYGD